MIAQRISHRRLSRLALVAVGLLVSLGIGSASVAAQATPAATPGPVDGACQVEPTSPERFVAALNAAAAAATPGVLEGLTLETLPAGEPADEATLAAVTATVETALACRNAGNFARVYALLSDRMIGQLYGGRETVPPEIVQLLTEPPRRIRPEFHVALVELSAVSRLPDGRAGALVVTANATHTFTDYLYFVDDNGRWLIDQAVAISAAPVSAATPAR